jgi:hypothetical protein
MNGCAVELFFFFAANVRLDPASEAELSPYQVALRIKQGEIVLAQQQHEAGKSRAQQQKEEERDETRRAPYSVQT